MYEGVLLICVMPLKLPAANVLLLGTRSSLKRYMLALAVALVPVVKPLVAPLNPVTIEEFLR